MSRLTDLRSALLLLSHTNDAHWEANGQPRLDAIEISPPPTRDEVAKFSIFRRAPAVAPPVVPKQQPVRAATPEEIQEVQDAAAQAEANVNAAQANVVRLTSQLRADRGAAAAALARWQRATGRLLTQNDLARAEIAKSQARKLAEANGEIEPVPRQPVADSYVDRAAQRYSGNDAFARKQIRTGSARGAYPASRRGEILQRRKLPSER